MNKLTKLPPAWHADAAEALRQNVDAIHAAFLDATGRAVSLGLFLNNIKQRGKEDGSIPHGQFGPWCAKHVLSVKYRQLHQYMDLAEGLIKFGKFQICDYRTFALGGELPQEIKLLIANKTQKQLLLEFKQADADGNPRGPGRLPGEGGRRALTLAEGAAALQKAVRDTSIEIRHMLACHDFTILGDDHLIDAETAFLELHIKARRSWVATPCNRRDPETLKKLWKTLQ